MLTAKRLFTVGAVLLVTAGLAAACTTGKPAATSASAPPAARGFPDEGIPTTAAAKVTVAHYTVGQTADITTVDAPVGQMGAVAPRLAVDPTRQTTGRLQISRVKFTTGSEYDTPERGLYLGAYLKAQVIHKTDLAWGLYAVVNGHHYDSTYVTEGFTRRSAMRTSARGRPTRGGWCSTCQPATALWSSSTR
jgi:hypothetical protein